MTKPKKEEKILGTEKEFLELFSTLCRSRHAWQVWVDSITAIACSIQNCTNRGTDRFISLEKEYADCIQRLGNEETISRLFAIIVMALENNPEQDFLGKLYMSLNLGNHWKGQFFTPYPICRLMSDITTSDLEEKIKEKGYVSVCDTACGAGATLIAAANSMKSINYNFQNHVLFAGQDIDRIAGLMCYIQLSLLGCAGYVAIGNSLTNPMTGHELFPEANKNLELWIMPMFMNQIWQTRKMIQLLGLDEKKRRNEMNEDERVEVMEEESDCCCETLEESCCLADEEEISEDAENIVSEDIEETNEVKETKTEDIPDDRPAKVKAKEKLEKELEEAKADTYSKPIIDYLLRRCEEDQGMAEDVCLKHKTFKKCFSYITDKAKKMAGGKGAACVRDEVVYEWAEDYYHKDDKEEEEKKIKEEKKAEKNEKPEKEKIDPKPEKFIQMAEKPKKIKKEKEIDGQLDFFSLMGIGGN